MLNSVVLGVIIVALIVIIILLATISAILIRRDKQRENVLEYSISHMMETAFKRETRKLAKMYAEEKRVTKWLEELSQEEKLDLSQLATDTEKRAYALALKKAEDAVDLAEFGLESIRQEIRKVQKEIAIHAKQPNLYKDAKTALRKLYDQEKIAEKRVKSMRKRLTLLTDDISSGNLDGIFQNLEAAPAIVLPMAVTEPTDLDNLCVSVEPAVIAEVTASADLVEPHGSPEATGFAEPATPSHDSPQSQN